MNTHKRPSRRHLARALALQALYAWKLSGTSMLSISSELLATDSEVFEAGERIEPSTCDRAYFLELVNNIPQKITILEEALAEHCDRDISELTPIEHSILWLALYELHEKVEIPFKVIVNEAVMLAKAFGVNEGHKYINGVLDKAAHSIREPAFL